MGAAACKNSKSTESKSDKKEPKAIVIGVFGLDDAGKTSTVKAIEGNPTTDVEPTEGSATSIIANPNKGGNSESVKLIDVSGGKKNREKLWPQFYKQIHGLIFVFDASEKKRVRENQEVLDSLLEHEDVNGKPILIFANKQDDRDAIKSEDTIRTKLSIEDLKTKHKIELCTAVPSPRKKSTDPSIREGISWLIQAIEADYDKLNARVNPTGKNAPQTPKQRGKATQPSSDSEDSLTKRRQDSSQNRKNKLPALDTNKKTGKPLRGHDTYDEDDDNPVTSKQRPKISDFDSRRTGSPPLPSSSDFTKKRTTGNTFGLRGLTNDTNPKPFRTSFETLPEEAPWSATGNRSTKTDDNLLKPSTKPSWSSDLHKRDKSPLSREPKVPPLALSSKRGNNSDDDDISYGQSFKSKPPTSSPSRFKDPYDDNRLTSSLRPLSAAKKPSSGIYGADDDNDDDKFGTKDFKKSAITTGSKLTKDPDLDDDLGKRQSRPWDRQSGLDDYRRPLSRGTGLPPTGPLGSIRSKSGDDYYSGLSKPDSKLKSSMDDLPPLSSKSYGHPLSSVKSTNNSKPNYDDDDEGFPSSNKATTRSRSPADPYGSSWKPSNTSKYQSQSDSASSPYKTNAPYKATDDDRLSSTNKFGNRSKLTDDYPPMSSPSSSRFKSNDDLPSKSTKTSSYGDDDYKYGSSPKPGAARSTFTSKDSSSSLNKGKLSSRYDDDDQDKKYGSSSKLPSKMNAASKYSDDDDDKYGSSSKTTTKPKTSSRFSDDEDDKYGSSSKTTTKPKTSSRFSDDDDDGKYGSSSKTTTKPKSTSKYSDDDDDKFGPSSKVTNKPKTTSKYSDDDNDKYGSSSKLTTKPKTTSKYSDDDDDKMYGSSSKTTTKPKTTTSKYSDDDDYKYGSSSKPGTNRSTSSNKPKTTSRFSDDEDDKYKSTSKSTTKPKATSKYSDDEDDKYGSSSKTTTKPKTSSRFSDDDDDDRKYGSPSKTTNKSNTASKYSDDDDYKYGSPSKTMTTKPKSTSKYSDDDDDKYGSSSKTTSKPKAASKYSDDDDDDKYGSSSKTNSYPSKTNSTSRVGGYNGGTGSRYN